MRKKLLALLMCATMVLGTGVTAFADTTTDTVDKIMKDNNSKFFKEVDANGVNGAVKDTVRVVKKSVDASGNLQVNKYDLEIRFVKKGTGYEPVVMFEDETQRNKLKPATKVNDVVDVTVDPTVANKSTTLKAVTAALTGKTSGDYLINLTGDNTQTGSYLYAWNGTAATIQRDGNPVALVDGTDTWVKVDSGNSTLEANSKILSGTAYGFGTVYAIVDKNKSAIENDANLKLALYNAVDKGEISDKALAVRITPIVQQTEVKTLEIPGVTTDSDKEYKNGAFSGDSKAVKTTKIYGNDSSEISNIAGGTYTLDADLLSGTPLKSASAVNVFKLTSYGAVYNEDLGVVPALVKAGSVAVDKTYSFDNLTTLTGIFVFDEGTVEDNNDGISEDTTTAAAADTSANTSASPKTGDVAPIAALAVVMMGACGAMVVASKKRA